jgi:hypothetical protein
MGPWQAATLLQSLLHSPVLPSRVSNFVRYYLLLSLLQLLLHLRELLMWPQKLLYLYPASQD